MIIKLTHRTRQYIHREIGYALNLGDISLLLRLIVIILISMEVTLNKYPGYVKKR
jgi:hypothetical protein